jgi:protein phosphatase
VKATITVGYVSAIGQVRDENEDSYCVLVGSEAVDSVDAFLVVADGMGGHRAGRVASSMAVTFLYQCYSAIIGNKMTDRIPSDISDAGSLLRRNIERLNAEVHTYSLSRNELNGMGTTLVTALIAGDSLLVGHVGDSRAYLVSNDQIRQLTDDHSWVAEQIRAGLIQPEEAEVHPWRNVISRAVGNQPDVSVDVTSIQFATGDTVILCSDGLSSMVVEDEILRVVIKDGSGRFTPDYLR